jgi:hypothetical protein
MYYEKLKLKKFLNMILTTGIYKTILIVTRKDIWSHDISITKILGPMLNLAISLG